MTDPGVAAEAARMLLAIARGYPSGSRAEQSKRRRIEGAAVALERVSQTAVSET